MLRLAPTQHPSFQDVPEWALKYVAYAYAKGYSKGTSSTTFSPDELLDAKSYVTFVLRALGYDDSKGDFHGALPLPTA